MSVVELTNTSDAPGYATVPDVLTATEVEALAAAVDRVIAADEASSHRRRRGSTFGIRNLLAIHEISQLAASTTIRTLIEPTLGRRALPVRAIFFDKTPGANWKVPWHQDLTVAVREKIQVPGFGPWSIKAGIPHVQPPREILENMLTFRLHLDDCDAMNGPLLVLPRSHTAGILDADQIVNWRESQPAVACTLAVGGAVLMRPLLLHASSAATAPRRRRVIHIEYAGDALPGGLQWHIQ